eukprot:Colp12_sorted_trinity150504_noHs@15641
MDAMAGIGSSSITGTQIFFNESEIKVLEADKFAATKELGEECKEFSEKITSFQTTVAAITDMFQKLSDEVEKEKLKAIGSRNLLESIVKQREVKQRRLQAIINENQIQLDRYRSQHASLVKTMADQQEFMEMVFRK